MTVVDWTNKARQLLLLLERIDLGYPLGENKVNLPASEALVQELSNRTGLATSAPLIDFYAACDGVSLPDVHNGYFIHPIELVLRGIDRGEPVKVIDPSGAIPIVAFGSDGGGGRFAIRTDGPQDVLYLPVGAVHNSEFDGIHTAVRTVSSDFPIFLERLLADVKAFVEDTPNWKYMV